MNYEYGHPRCMKEYPHHSKIEPRCFERLDSEAELRYAIGTSLLRKRQKLKASILKEAIKRCKLGLEKDIERYEDIRARGDKAMSDYDMMMGYTAQNSGLPLKYAHIGFKRGQLRIFKHWYTKLYKNMDIEKGTQAGLFP